MQNKWILLKDLKVHRKTHAYLENDFQKERMKFDMERKPIKLLIMDIDGTLVTNKKEISPATCKALIDLQNNGVRLALASGRPAKGMLRFARQLEMDKHHGLLISSNGAKAEEINTGKVLFEHALSVAEAQAVLEHLKAFNVRPMIEDGDYMQVNNVFDCMITTGGRKFNVIEYEAHSNGFLLKESSDLAKSVNFRPSKILTAGDEEYLKDHWKEIAEPFKETLDSVFTSPFYYEFTAKDTNKGSAIEALDYEKDEIAAIGDAQNDLPMFRAAGTKIAMGNSVDVVKEAADFVTDTNENDGIAKWIETYFG